MGLIYHLLNYIAVAKLKYNTGCGIEPNQHV